MDSPRPLPNRGTNMARISLCSALAFGCIMGASMLKLYDVGNAVGGASDLAQWVKIALFLGLAWLCPRFTLPLGRLAVFGCVTLVATYVPEYIFLVQAPQAALFDGILSFRGLFSLMQGIMEFAFTLVCARLFSLLPPKHSSVAVSLGLVVNMAILCLQPVLITPQITMARAIILAVGATFACLGAWAARSEAFSPAYERPQRSNPEVPFVLFVGCATVFSLLFGYLRRSSLHYEVLIGVPNLAGQLILLAVVLGLFAYAWLRGITVRGDMVVYLLAPLFAGSFAAGALLPANGLYVADVMAGAGYAALRLLLWTTLARLAYSRPERLNVYVALVVIATTLGSQLGFEVAQYLAVHSISVPLGWSCIVAVALCGCCCLTVAPGYRSAGLDDLDNTWLLGSVSNKDGSAETRPGENGPVAIHAGTARPDQTKGIPVATENARSELATFTDYYGLSQREAQILAEATRGYTMAVIAEKTGLSGNTVRTYMRRVYIKCGVDNKQQLLELLDGFAR